MLVATGTHRGNTDEELRRMLGDEVLDAVRVVNHDARDDASLDLDGPLGADVPVWLNGDWVEADVRITTGLRRAALLRRLLGWPEDGRARVWPASRRRSRCTTRRASAHPDARWGVTEGNPVHDDVRAIAAATGTDFALDVILDGEQRIVQAFGGELFAMHRSACARG